MWIALGIAVLVLLIIAGAVMVLGTKKGKW